MTRFARCDGRQNVYHFRSCGGGVAAPVRRKVLSMSSLLIRFGPRDEPLRAAILAVSPGARSRAIRDALRLVFLGPSVLQDLAQRLSTLPDPATVPGLARDPGPVSGLPTDITDDFFAEFKP